MTQSSPRFARPLPHQVPRYVLGALCGALLTSIVGTSWAEDPAENVAAARTLGTEGVQLADAGKCPEAIEKLQRAEALHHAPTILGRLGECQVNIGQIVEGTENLNMVVREPLAANAPKVFHEAQERAQKVLAAATPKIAYLTIRLAPLDVKANVAVEGKAVPAALIGAERPTNPGTHQVTASAEGFQPTSATVTLAEGAHQDVTLLLEKAPNSAVVPPFGETPAANAATTTTTTPAEPPAPGPKKANVPAYVAFGVGGAGLIVGSVAGVLALSKASDCPDKVCATQSDLDSAKSMATISTIGFGVGIAGVALGTILLLTHHDAEAAPAQARPKRAPKLALQPWVGVSSVGLMGSFQ